MIYKGRDVNDEKVSNNDTNLPANLLLYNEVC